MRTESRSRLPAALIGLGAVGIAAVGIGVLLTAGCGSSAPGRDGIGVVAAFYPLQFVAERVGGPAVTVTTLAPPGAEPHDLELSPRQVAQVADARLVVYLKGFQPAVDETVAQQAASESFDVSRVVPLLDAVEGAEDQAGDEPGTGSSGTEETALGGKDPHLWLDPTRLAAIGDRLADRLAELDPARSADFRARAGALRAELDRLDGELSDGLKTCSRRQIVTSHAAFGYLAARYNLEQIPISGLGPESEPSPRHLAEVAGQAKRLGATTIFFETLVSPQVAETLAREVGARTAVLDPIEGLPPGSTADYLSVMRDNLATLRPALGCA